MKGHLAMLFLLALARPAITNEIHGVSVNVREMEIESGGLHIEAAAEFQDIPVSLVLNETRTGVEILSVSIDGRQLTLDTEGLKSVSGLRPGSLYLEADCCIMGVAFYWHLPFGKARRCRVTTPDGRRERQMVYRELFIRVSTDLPSKALVVDPC